MPHRGEGVAKEEVVEEGAVVTVAIAAKFEIRIQSRKDGSSLLSVINDKTDSEVGGGRGVAKGQG